MKKRKLLTLLLLTGLPAAAVPALAADNPVILPIDEPEAPETHRIIWPTDPGIRYELQQSTDLAEWTTVAGFPTEAAALARQHRFEAAGGRLFFRVVELDEQPPVIVSRQPADRAFGVRRFSTIWATLSDKTGVDPDSITLAVGGHGDFTLADAELSFETGILVFDPGGDTALGDWGEEVGVSLSVADVLGNDITYEWTFDLETQAIVADNIFVFGSPDARRAGQQLGAIPTRVLSDRMLEGPIRMSAEADPWTLVSVHPDRIKISYTGDAPPEFSEGAYLCNLTPASLDELFYRRLLSVSEDPREKILTLFTEEVSLEELVVQGSLTSIADSIYFTIGEGGEIKTAMDWEITLPSMGHSLDGWSFSLDEDGFDILSVETKELHWWFTPSFYTGLEIDSAELRRFEAVAGGDLDAAMVIEAEVLLLGIGLEVDIFSLPHHLRPGFWVPTGFIGPVPVSTQVQFNFTVSAEAMVGAHMQFETGIRKHVWAEFGIDYASYREPAVNWIADGEFAHELIPLSVDVGGKLELKLKLKPSVSLLVYGLAGLEASVAPGAGVEFTAGADGVKGHLKADVSLGLEPAGPALAWLDPKPSISRALWERKWRIYPSPSPTPGELVFIQHPESITLTAGNRLALSAEAVSSSPVAYEWFKDGGDPENLYQYGDNHLEIARTDPSHAGDYFVRATSGGVTADSETATVTIVPPPEAIPDGMAFVPGGTTVDSFFMDRHLVTKELWDKVRTWGLENGYTDLREGSGKGPDHPVFSVNWYDIVKWCNARSEMEGLTPAYYTSASLAPEHVYRTGTPPTFLNHTLVNWNTGYRLASNAEWVYAARGGLSGRRFPWGDKITHKEANYWSSDRFDYDVSETRGHHPDHRIFLPRPFTSPSGSFPPNGYGLHDMAGNLFEYVFDHRQTSTGTERIIRGGFWGGTAETARIGFSSSQAPTRRDYTLGFRSVLPAGTRLE